MKRLMIAMLLAVLMCSSAMAAEGCFNAKGSTLVSDVLCRNKSDSQFFKTNLSISNITSSNVTCRVKVYDHNGDDVSTSCSIWVGSPTGSFVSVSSGKNVFEIPAHSSRIYSFLTDQKSVVGYAVIEWTSDNEDLRKALIATKRYEGVSRECFAAMCNINSGQPF